LPTDTLREDLLSYFEPRRMMTTVLDVRGPEYADVFIEGELLVEPRFSRAQVKKRAEDAILALWAFDSVDFGDTLYISKIYEAIEAVEGVAAVTVSRFSRAPSGEPAAPSDGKLTFDPHEIPRLQHPRGIKLTKVDGGRSDG
jgi:hypothetical protein